MSYITKANDGKPLAELNKGNLNVKTLPIVMPANLATGATAFTLIFPFDIRVIGLGITNGGSAPTGGQNLVFTLTDGASPIAVTMLGGGAVPVQEAEDQLFSKNTELDVDFATGAGNTAEQAIFHIHYIPILPTVR